MELSLTERRRATTRLDIALAAARLLSAAGSGGVTVEAIAAEAGVSLRTFYRYFPTKEDAVAPLLSVGADDWQSAVAAALDDPADTRRGSIDGNRLRAAIASAIRTVLSPDGPEEAQALERAGGLLRAALTDTALRSVWLRVNGESERRLLGVFRELLGPGDEVLDARLFAAAATAAVRIGLEEWAESSGDRAGAKSDPAERAGRAFRALSAGLVAVPHHGSAADSAE